MVIDRLLHELAVLLPICLWDVVPYQLLDAGVDVFLGIARHGRILTAAVERGREGARGRLNVQQAGVSFPTRVAGYLVFLGDQGGMDVDVSIGPNALYYATDLTWPAL